MRRASVLLVGIAVAMAFAHSRFLMVMLTLAGALPYFMAIRALRTSAEGPRSMRLIFAIALTLHALPLAAPLVLSDDVYRYLWDARVAAFGIDPNTHAPDAKELVSLRNTNHARINHPSVRTIYPAAAQGYFHAIYAIADHPLSFRIAAAVANLLTLWVLSRLLVAQGLDPRLALIYGWSPLAAVEAAVGAHLDCMAILLLVCGLWAWQVRKDLFAGVALGLSTMVKLGAAPIVLLLGRRPRLLVAFFLLVFGLYWATPMHMPGFADYASRWRFNPSLFALIEAAVSWITRLPPEGTGLLARGIVAGLWLALLWILLHKGTDPLEGGKFLSACALLLSPTVHPWYALWLLPFCALRPSGPLLLFVSLLPISYFGESFPLRLLEYGPPLLLLARSLKKPS